jgi:hypothetical protein
MPRAFSMTKLGIPLKPILDPLARSDVSIGQSPCNLVPATPKLSVERPFEDRKGAGSRATVIPAGFWQAELSKEMVHEGWRLILDYHSSIPRNFGRFQVRRQISSRGRLDIAGVPQTLSAFCLHAYCVNLMQFLGRSSSPISGEHLPPNGELLARWSSQGEEHTHALRKRASAGGVRRPKRYAFGARGGLEHRALGPSRLARVF